MDADGLLGDTVGYIGQQSKIPQLITTDKNRTDLRGTKGREEDDEKGKPQKGRRSRGVTIPAQHVLLSVRKGVI